MPVQIWALSTVAIVALATTTYAQQPKVSDKDYVAKAVMAAPEAITKGAAVVAMENDGTMRTLQKGTNSDVHGSGRYGMDARVGGAHAAAR